MSARPLRVFVDARATPEAGGVRQALIGLAAGLAELDGPEEYTFLVFEDEQEWIRPYVPGALVTSPLPQSSAARRLLRGAMGKSSALRKLAARSTSAAVPESDGTAERDGADVVHLAMPFGFRTPLPTVYTVYDLQHLHFPELFHPATIVRRETTYRALCDQATAVTTLSHWGRDDVVARYGLPEEKVVALGLSSAVELYPAPDAELLEATRARLAPGPEFALFPANTWPHKNHLGLVEALALLRDRGVEVPVVCSGFKTDHFPAIERRVRELRLESLVSFPEYVSSSELRALYELCRCVVFPTKFEGWGMPLTEALATGRPAACSAIPPLLEQTRDAAVMFEPDDPGAIADAVERVWTDEELREELVAKGRRQAAATSWEDIARGYRTLYREAAERIGAPLARA
jgi:glycosyltransferase involved in cell wall biosynthesis